CDLGSSRRAKMCPAECGTLSNRPIVLVASTSGALLSWRNTMTDFNLDAQERSDLGKGASRRLRRNANLVPAVIYGGEAAPQSISILAKDLAKMLENEIAFSNIIKLSVYGKSQDVVIKALQRHPAKGFVLHADFQRVVAGQKLTATVPVHLINQETSIGVKQQGGEI